MRTLPLGLVVAVGGCLHAGGQDDLADTGLSSAVTDATCSATYSVSGSFGDDSGITPDPHQDVFGEDQTVGIGVRVGPDPLHVHLGWPGRDTSRSISFVWQTDTGTLSSVVELAEGTDLSGTVDRREGVSFTFGGGATVYRVHELKVCGDLKPGTTYSYRVGGEGHWSDVHTFTTPGAPGSFDTFTVVVAGDSRGSYEDWGTLMQRAAAESPDFFVFTGDMVALGGNQTEWHAWWGAIEDIVAETVLVPAHGNHEFLAANYFAQFSLPGNEQWFSVDYGPATFVSLNDTVAEPATIAGVEADFLRSTLSGSEAPWKVAFHHQTMVTASDGHDPNFAAYAAWGPILEEEGADLVLAGHNHLYERSKPVAGGEAVADGEGPVYMVTGGAGAPLYTDITSNAAKLALNAAHAQTEHYLVLEFSPEGIHGTAKDMSGNVLDSFDVVDR